VGEFTKKEVDGDLIMVDADGNNSAIRIAPEETYFNPALLYAISNPYVKGVSFEGRK